jgi:hypothetical protein
MEFRLTYKGKLPSVTSGDTRVAHKHRIRKEIHKQLRYLWETHPNLAMPFASLTDGSLYISKVADKYARCGFRFVPLVGEQSGVACALDILFLRRDFPGNMISHRGDIDNRIKVLFDALQVPDNCDQLPKGAAPDEGEDPMFCLLWDDRLITELKVTTDRLLTPPMENESVNEVQLVIGVRILARLSQFAAENS